MLNLLEERKPKKATVEASSETQGQLVGGGEKSKQARKKFGRRKVKKENSSPEFFSRLLRLFPAPTNCPWVSEDAVEDDHGLSNCVTLDKF